MSDPELPTLEMNTTTEDEQVKEQVTSLYRLGVIIGKKVKAIKKLEETLFDMV